MKTISDLNSKAWYRLIKVFFVAVFLIILIISNYLIFSGGFERVDERYTMIQCNLKDKKSFSAKNINLQLSTEDFINKQFNYQNFFKNYNNEYKIEDIFQGCFMDTDVTLMNDVYDQQKAIEIVNKYGLIGKNKDQPQISIFEKDFSNYKQQTSNLFGNQKIKYLDFNFEIFNIIPIFTYKELLYQLLISNFLILFIFETTKRCFYYIILGDLKPLK